MNISFCAEKYKQALESVEDINSCPKVPLPQINDHQNYIFISYSHKDFKSVYADLADMYEAGVRFWYDSGLSAGKKWDEEVEEKILSPYCVGVIFYISENLFLSQSANREIEIMHRCATAIPDGEHCSKNYFCVNLANRQPVDILSAAIRNDTDRKLDMRQISILSQAFPDDVTYIPYAAPNYKEMLIDQIRTQFGVINETGEKQPFDIDGSSSTVYVGSFEKISHEDRQRMLRDLRDYMKEKGISVYIAQDAQETALHDDLSAFVKEYIDRQNAVKLETAKFVLALSTALGWGVAARYFGEFDPNMRITKTVLYLIDDSVADVEWFAKFYHLDTEEPAQDSVLNRVFFVNDDNYREKLAEAILKEASITGND